MCGTLKTKYECKESGCSEIVSTNTDSLKCAQAKTYWGECGSISKDNKEVTKRGDKICRTCDVKKDQEERRKRLAAAAAAREAALRKRGAPPPYTR